MPFAVECISGYGNHVEESPRAIQVKYSEDITINDNEASADDYGIVFHYVDTGLVYNNNFTADVPSHAYENTDTIWYIDPPISSENIIGGPNIGGNYYSDYTGCDINETGFGNISYQTPGAGYPDIYPLTNTACP